MAPARSHRAAPPRSATVIAGHEYETFPRGRVVYMQGPALFTLYADRRLQRPETIADLVRRFGLTGQDHAVRSDAHYRTRA